MNTGLAQFLGVWTIQIPTIFSVFLIAKPRAAWRMLRGGQRKRKASSHNRQTRSLSTGKCNNLIHKLDRFNLNFFLAIVLQRKHQHFFNVGPRKEDIFFDHLQWSIFQSSYTIHITNCLLGL